jgi:polysaccharide biosynthesis/export protein PslD
MASLLTKFRLVSVLTILALTSCAPTWVAAKYQQPSRFATWVKLPPSAYKIQPGDDLSVVLPFNPELNFEAPVAPDGTWTMPLGGAVPVAGFTVSQAADNIDTALAKNGVTANGYASVSIRQYAGQVYVGGFVTHPGAVPLQNGMDVLQAITVAGGMQSTARSHEVVLIRRSPDGRPMLRTIDVDALTRDGDPSQEVALQPSDTIFVPQSSIAEVDQWVEQYLTKVVPFNPTINYNFGNGNKIP